MHAVLFWGHLLAIAMEKIHVIVIALKKEKKKEKIHQANQFNRADNTQTPTKLYTLHRTQRTKTILCPGAHSWIGHIREYTPRVLYKDDLQNALMISGEVPLFV